MKARVKATGEIVDVDECGGQVFKDMGWDYMDMRGRCYKSEDLDFNDNTPFDYWTRLEHQYVGMAMQGILSNPAFPEHSQEGYYKKNVVNNAYEYAHALVELYKRKE